MDLEIAHMYLEGLGFISRLFTCILRVEGLGLRVYLEIAHLHLEITNSRQDSACACACWCWRST